jgi:hypothetical protein
VIAAARGLSRAVFSDMRIFVKVAVIRMSPDFVKVVVYIEGDKQHGSERAEYH